MKILCWISHSWKYTSGCFAKTGNTKSIRKKGSKVIKSYSQRECSRCGREETLMYPSKYDGGFYMYWTTEKPNFKRV